jgi:hypothetical protein
MLLIEITDPIRKDNITFDKKYTFDPKAMPTRFKLIGSGYGGGVIDSEVYKDLKHPSRVLKVVKVFDAGDPYIKFIKLTINHQDNPFFPRIYGYKIHEEEGDQSLRNDNLMYDHYTVYVFMEKLIPIHKFDDSMVRQQLKTIGINYTGPLTDSFELSKLMKNAADRSHIASNSLIPKFQEAMSLLEPLFKEAGSDMHIDNIMMRLTKYGPQFVIIDPLFPE